LKNQAEMQPFFAHFAFPLSGRVHCIKNYLIIYDDTSFIGPLQEIKARSNVVFPLPEGPIIAITSPFSNENQSFSKP